MGTISTRKAIVIIIIACTLSSVSTFGAIYAAPEFFSMQVSQENQIGIVRFIAPEEQNMTKADPFHQDLAVLAVFTWSPANLTSNAILEAYVQFEYYYENPPEYVWDWGAFWWELGFVLTANEFRYEEYRAVRLSAADLQEREEGSFRWEQTCFKAQPNQGLWIVPNQANYTLTFQASHRDRGMGYSPTHTYLRNINVILEVIDGI